MTKAQRQLLKLGVFIAWPVLGIASLLMVIVAFTATWLIIPFAQIENVNDSIRLKLPWSQTEPSDP